jgi:hypothetical protein
MHPKIHGEGAKVELLSLLISTLDGTEWSVSRLDRFNPSESTTFTHWIREWVGCGAILDDLEKKDVCNSCGESNPDF